MKKRKRNRSTTVKVTFLPRKRKKDRKKLQLTFNDVNTLDTTKIVRKGVTPRTPISHKFLPERRRAHSDGELESSDYDSGAERQEQTSCTFSPPPIMGGSTTSDEDRFEISEGEWASEDEGKEEPKYVQNIAFSDSPVPKEKNTLKKKSKKKEKKGCRSPKKRSDPENEEQSEPVKKKEKSEKKKKKKKNGQGSEGEKNVKLRKWATKRNSWIERQNDSVDIKSELDKELAREKLLAGTSDEKSHSGSGNDVDEEGCISEMQEQDADEKEEDEDTLKKREQRQRFIASNYTTDFQYIGWLEAQNGRPQRETPNRNVTVEKEKEMIADGMAIILSIQNENTDERKLYLDVKMRQEQQYSDRRQERARPKASRRRRDHDRKGHARRTSMPGVSRNITKKKTRKRGDELSQLKRRVQEQEREILRLKQRDKHKHKKDDDSKSKRDDSKLKREDKSKRDDDSKSKREEKRKDEYRDGHRDHHKRGEHKRDHRRTNDRKKPQRNRTMLHHHKRHRTNDALSRKTVTTDVQSKLVAERKVEKVRFSATVDSCSVKPDKKIEKVKKACSVSGRRRSHTGGTKPVASVKGLISTFEEPKAILDESKSTTLQCNLCGGTFHSAYQKEIHKLRCVQTKITVELRTFP
eukprot:TRINITY_DN469_c0_g1_i2.p1 TRINITY_DN469_c0_g1~~TRINITY_DN469_c0_g1_i2.p1  ORF type:complete len:637 (-),score=141.71 TRINITY_DN469_c0_g1_i2:891-2801(-)